MVILHALMVSEILEDPILSEKPIDLHLRKVQAITPEDEENGTMACGIDIMTNGYPIIDSLAMHQKCISELPPKDNLQPYRRSSLQVGNTFIRLISGPERDHDLNDGSCKDQTNI